MVDKPDDKPKRVAVDDSESFDVVPKSNATPRIKGTYIARIVGVEAAETRVGKKPIKRYYLTIQLDVRRPDGSPYEAEFNCLKCWKPGAEYQELAAKVLGRPFTDDERLKGVGPTTLMNLPFEVFVTEHRQTKGDGSSTLKILEIKAAGAEGEVAPADEAASG